MLLLYESFWKKIGGCGAQILQLNHCLGLAKSAGFEWLFYIRNIDKFLHTDDEELWKPGLLKRFLDKEGASYQDAGFAMFRRDCGVRQSTRQIEVPTRQGSALAAPVFADFTLCESRTVAAVIVTEAFCSIS